MTNKEKEIQDESNRIESKSQIQSIPKKLRNGNQNTCLREKVYNICTTRTRGVYKTVSVFLKNIFFSSLFSIFFSLTYCIPIFFSFLLSYNLLVYLYIFQPKIISGKQKISSAKVWLVTCHPATHGQQVVNIGHRRWSSFGIIMGRS